MKKHPHTKDIYYHDDNFAFKCTFEFYLPCARANNGIQPSMGLIMRFLTERFGIGLAHKIFGWMRHPASGFYGW